MELKAIDEAQKEAEKFFEREQKRDDLKKVDRDLYNVACALNRRGGYSFSG